MFFSYEALCAVAVLFGWLAGSVCWLDLGAVIVGGNFLFFPGPIPLLIYLAFFYFRVLILLLLPRCFLILLLLSRLLLAPGIVCA